VTAFVTAGAGFLLAVLWFDLMFDVQVRAHRGTDIPPHVLTSIGAYYQRVTTSARPMNRLVGIAMIATIVAIVVQLARGDVPTWLSVASLLLVGGPVGLAAARTVPTAVRLGAATDSPSHQGWLARSIWRDHLLCLSGIAALLVLQLVFGRSALH
jgi:hypothetical protein